MRGTKCGCHVALVKDGATFVVPLDECPAQGTGGGWTMMDRLANVDARMRLSDVGACHVVKWDPYCGRVVCGARFDVVRLSSDLAAYSGSDTACAECVHAMRETRKSARGLRRKAVRS